MGKIEINVVGVCEAGEPLTEGVQRVALVTGCTSGIGEATALVLGARGFRVYASGRTLAGVEHLHDRVPGLEVIELDVRSDVSIESAVSRILHESGRFDVLVNNAGVGVLGATEDLDRGAWQRQFEVNLFGAAALTRAVLPTMRAQRDGYIVNVSSVAGRVSVPLMGAYCSSKFALEALSDALRVECRPFGIRVVVVEPGTTHTKFQERAMAESSAVLRKVDSIFAPVYRHAFLRYTVPSIGATAEDVAQRIARIVTKRRPAARYRVKWYDTLSIAMTRVLPRRAIDYGIARWVGLQRLPVSK